MTIEIALAFAILIGAFIIFALDLYPVDLVALGIMSLIMVLGPILGVTAEETISGFSNPATITVLAMFILSGGVYRTGAVNLLAQYMVRFAGENELRQLFTVMLVVSPISIFINNTAAVAILIPSVIILAREHGRQPSRLLMPLSFFSQLAGVITLIGTSTNILASALLEQAGYGAFGMFEFAPVGLLVFATGSLYVLFVAPRLLPERLTDSQLTEVNPHKPYLTEAIILPKSPLEHKVLNNTRLRKQLNIPVVGVIRNGYHLTHPPDDKILLSGDILLIQASASQLLNLKEIEGLEIEPEYQFFEEVSDPDQEKLLEVVIGPNSDLIGGTLQTTNFYQRYNCTVIAIRHHGELLRQRLRRRQLHFGDTLLLRGSRAALGQIKREPGFILGEELPLRGFRTRKTPLALAIVIGVVLMAALGQPILMTTLVGCVLMVLTGCLRMNELHESIRMDVIFLLAGVIPLGLAIERTGGAQLLADIAVMSSEYVPPLVVLGIFCLTAMALTALISNNATVVILVPVALATAETLNLSPKAFILVIMFAASTSFATPIGYQTNTMIFGPGGYKFLDFTKVGLPLNLLLAVLTPVYIYFMVGL